MKLYNIKDKILIVCEQDYFPFFFAFKKKNPSLNIKIISRSDLLDKVAYRFSKDPIPYLIKEKGIEYSKAKRYVNLLRLGVHEGNEKLKTLLNDIKECLTVDEYGLYELKGCHLFLFEMDEDKDVTSLLNKKDISFEHLHFEDLDEQECDEFLNPKIIYFSDKFAQFCHIFSEIREKLLSDPSLQHRIEILVKDYNDIFYIQSLSRLFNIDVFANIRSPLRSDPIISKKINDIYLNRFFSFSEDELRDENIKLLYDLIKKYRIDEIEDFDFAYLNISEILNSQMYDTPLSEKGIAISSTYLFDPNALIYITNFEQGSFYKEYADNNVLSDGELSALGLSTSYDKTKLDERKKKNFIKYNHVLLYSRVKQHLSDSIYDSHFMHNGLIDVKPEEMDKKEEINLDGIYTTPVSKLIKAFYYDQYSIYQQVDDYLSYDRKFKGVSANELMVKERWSITNLEKYVDCPFKYYLDRLINLDSMDKHHAYRGTLIHSVLEDIYHPEFSFEKSFERGVKEYKKNMERNGEEFTNKEEVYIEIYRHWLSRIIPSLLRQKEHMNLIEEKKDYEVEVKFDIAGYPFKGSIDRLIYTKNGDEIYYTIVDYKTGSEDYDPEALPIGKCIQLPLYYYAISNNEELTKGGKLGGFMIQHPFFNTIKSAFVDKDYFSESNLLASLRYSGVHLSDERYTKSFDDTYFQNDESKKKGGAFLNDKLTFNDVDDDSILLNKYKDDVSRFNVNDSVNASLKAAEEIIESIKNNEFEITPSQIEITKAVTSSSRARCQYCEHRNICYRKGYDPLKDYSKIIKDKLLDMEVK